MKSLKEWQIKALEFRHQGMSSRKICEQLGWNKTSKSTVNDFFKRYDIQHQAAMSVYNSTGVVDNRPKLNQAFKNSAQALLKIGESLQNFSQTEHGEEFDKFELFDNKKTILVIADTQCKSEEDLEYMLWIGQYIADKQPDVIVHIGDHYDFPSLSSYDKGKSSAEGRRLVKDIEAGNTGFEFLNLAMNKLKNYNPRKVFCLGNHENRLERYIDDNPELIGTLGVDKLPFSKYGWEVHPFLKPVEINGIFFVHYLANPFSEKPYGGNAMNILKTVGRSFVVGHKQCLDIAIRPTIDGKQQIGIINGACYPYNESYKGFQGNNHFRGLTVLHEVEDGFGVPMFVSLDFMKNKYYS